MENDQNLLKTMTVWELLEIVLSSFVFKIFYVTLIFHISFLVYCIGFKWQLRSIGDLWWYIPRIRRYIGCIIGMFSAILSLKSVDIADENFSIAFVLIMLSFLLTIKATLIAYGPNGHPDLLVGATVTFLGFITCLPSLKAFILPDLPCAVVLRSFIGVFHSLVGLVLIVMNLREQERRPRGMPWRMRNGNPAQMT